MSDISHRGPNRNPELQRLADLKLLSAWADELHAKTRRAELLFEHFGIDVGLEGLPDEIAGFTAVVAGIGAEQREVAEQHEEKSPAPRLKVIRGGRTR